MLRAIPKEEQAACWSNVTSTFWNPTFFYREMRNSLCLGGLQYNNENQIQKFTQEEALAYFEPSIKEKFLNPNLKVQTDSDIQAKPPLPGFSSIERLSLETNPGRISSSLRYMLFSIQAKLAMLTAIEPQEKSIANIMDSHNLHVEEWFPLNENARAYMKCRSLLEQSQLQHSENPPIFARPKKTFVLPKKDDAFTRESLFNPNNNHQISVFESRVPEENSIPDSMIVTTRTVPHLLESSAMFSPRTGRPFLVDDSGKNVSYSTPDLDQRIRELLTQCDLKEGKDFNILPNLTLDDLLL
jgi:hypothetical protein